MSKKQALLFPGCVIQNRLPFLEKSARLVFEKLDYEIKSAPFSCCPDPVGVASISQKTWLVLAARNLSFGEKENTEILSLCNGCSETLLRAKKELQRNKKELKEVNYILGMKGYKYKGKAKVSHFVRTIVEDVGLGKIKKIVKNTWANSPNGGNPLAGKKIAAHPGCHYNRPSEVLDWDDPLDPKYQDKIINAIGAIPVNYDEKTLCCGSCVARTREDVGLEIMKKKYESVTDAGGEIISVNCPACFQQVEQYQRSVNKKFETTFQFPVLYITELIALAFGFTPADIGFKFHSVGRKVFS
jgi:heterodisulfide reductase subunit B